METKDYLGYIAHYITNNQLITKYEFRRYFMEELGAELFSAPEKKIKDLARHLYKSYIVSIYTRYSSFSLAKALSSKELEDLLEDQRNLDQKYKITNLRGGVVGNDIKKSSVVDKHIKEQAERNYKAILLKMDEAKSPSTIKEKEAKERAVKREKKASAAKKVVKKNVTTSSKGSKEGVEVTAKRTKYTLKELKDLAAAAKIPGRSTMDKAALMKALRLK